MNPNTESEQIQNNFHPSLDTENGNNGLREDRQGYTRAKF